ncbi:ADL377Wp [Eremothecium gossypii ATCC 10895]|uniref:protein-serine/threonine phosphatase n=1 Tax=Eremothecium gossypii (strain ATCC 10895 / CBS 109.51 / FGSC 9923 / NRRL Y-1056) TaxID=284811 RepID=Q75BE1_EREGS|nr:ADL377Wp [Eremothecium gossypii ATCC 10895]AAS51543.2 ADL377Wp [Eremothecium gossypii ATCC 10895]AEY95839.1 FADL377Wp [Eremothecium gossypii FDAG1]
MGQLLSHPLTEKTIVYNDYLLEANGKHANLPDGSMKPYAKERHHRHLHLRRQFTENKSQEVVLTDTSSEITKEHASCTQFFNCVGSMQGYRMTQEDAHLVSNCDTQLVASFRNPMNNNAVEKLRISVFGVFDGHGGDECSQFLADSEKGLLKWIKYSFENHEYCSISDSASTASSRRAFCTVEGLISQIFRDAFALQDKDLHCHFANSPCGSTAVVAAIINSETLYVVNCGDSRCILASMNSCIKTMSFDHKPQHIGELIRINDDGGTVSLGRVGGVLALSRAFGDFQFKRSVAYKDSQLTNSIRRYIPAAEAQVTVEPDVLTHSLDYAKDEFLVLACDGIWDIYSNKALTQFIKYHLTLGLRLDDIVTKLLDHGLAGADSNTGVGFDNMTIIIIVLNKPGETLSQWYAKMKMRMEQEKGLV